VDASIEFRKDPESFRKRVKKSVEKSLENLPDGFEMPKLVQRKKTPQLEDNYFYDEDNFEFDMEEFSDDSIKTEDLNDSDFEEEIK
jgi:ubiquitin-conjugating enzyme E2 R